MPSKKTAIIEATIRCIANHGLNKTNAQLVAKELGIAQSSVFYHFPQQQQLFDSLLHHVAKVNADEVKSLLTKAQATNHFERLCHYIRGNLQWAVNHQDQVMVLIYSLSEGKHSPQVNTEIIKILKKAEDRLYFYLVAGIAEGEFSVEGDLRALAKFINQSVSGTVVTRFQLLDEWDIDTYMSELITILKRLINLT